MKKIAYSFAFAFLFVFIFIGMVSAYQYYSISDAELNSGYTNVLNGGDEFRFSLDGIDYHIMASGVSQTIAQMSIPPISSLQILNLNEEQKFELTGDNYYDISLTLTDTNWSINGAGYPANFNGTFIIKRIRQEIAADTILPDSCFKYYTCSDGTRVQYCEFSGQGCGCKSPQSLCPSPSQGGGGGGGATNLSNNTNGGGSGSYGGNGSSSSCVRYYTCPDGTQVNYCSVISSGNGAGCGCSSNPSSFCTSPSNGGGGGAGVNSSNSSGGGGGQGVCLNGCLLNNSCVSVGFRINNSYCDLSKSFLNQKVAGSNCENNFECSTNLCIDNQCVSSNLWQKLIRFLSRLFGR